MNRPRNKLKQEEQVEQVADQRQAQGQATAIEFKTAEDALRYDRDHTALPAGIAARLDKASDSFAPSPRRAWWRFWSR